MQDLYAMNKKLIVESINLGNEGEKILIIDNLMISPELMVNFAVEEAGFYLYKKEGNFYPGIRLPPPKGYFDCLMSVIRPILNAEYEINSNAKMTKAECAVSLVTLKPEELSKMQSLPHFDSVNPDQFALLHYLCNEKHGGTAFYRSNLTGYETVTRERFEHYTTTFVEDIENNGPPKQEYFVDSNERFTKIGSVDIKYNRLIIYRSCLLHSGLIDSAISVDPDPRTGRLTANAFVAFER
jgi:hypothetical protein